MVNLQQEAETDLDYLQKLVQHEIRLFRLNCAFGTMETRLVVDKNLKNAATDCKKRLIF